MWNYRIRKIPLSNFAFPTPKKKKRRRRERGVAIEIHGCNANDNHVVSTRIQL